MFKKVQFRLTLLCGGITTLLLIIMTLGYLRISEKNLEDTRLFSFKNNISTIAANLEQQSVITHEWLSSLESSGNYLIYLLDNGVPFLFNEHEKKSDSQALFTEALTYYEEHFSVEAVNPAFYSTIHLEFSFASSSGEEYYASVITYEKESSILQMLVLSSLSPMKAQLANQRFLFLLIIVLVVISLWIFSYFFTKKLLLPVEKSRKSQTEFVASASHELRTPLAVIFSCLESFQTASDEKKEDFLAIMKLEAGRMSSLVNDLLTLSQSDNYRFSIDKRPVELDTLLLNSYEAFEPLAQEKKLTLSVSLPDNTVPPCSCDSHRISQAVSVLLHNALSYTEKGGSIALTLQYQKGGYFISVADNGPGISDEDKKKVFNRFYRAEKSRSAKGHFGLGLSIAYEIIKAHNGSISISDAPGGGAVFTIRLP